MMYQSTKLFQYFSAAFRQPNAGSHCKLLHGYGLSIRVTFEAETLDARNWVVDFGGLKDLKAEFESIFDHKTLVAANDPDLEFFRLMETRGICELTILPAVGIEYFARHACSSAQRWLQRNNFSGRVRVAQVEVFEHLINSAIYKPS